MVDRIYCIPDTNMLLHFQTFDEVDWPGKLGATNVCIVITAVVLRELDKHKSNPINSQRQKRARMLLGKLRDYLKSSGAGEEKIVRSHVTLIDMPLEPHVDWAKLRLDPEVNDDRLLAATIQFAVEHPNDTVIMVSNDFGVLRKAAALSIANIDPDGLIENHEFSTDEQKAIGRLQKRVKELEQRQPHINIGFEDGSTHVSLRRLPRPSPKTNWRSDNTIEEEVDLEIRSCRKLANPTLHLYGKEHFESYFDTVGRYGEDLRAFFRQQRCLEAGWRIQFSVMIENVGSAPANDVRVSVFLPQDWVAVPAKDFDQFSNPTRPNRPHIPKPPTPFSGLFAGASPPIFSSQLFLPRLEALDSPRLSIPRSGVSKGEVWLEHPKLRAKETWTSAEVIVFAPPFTGQGIELGWTIHVDEYTEPEKGKLQIVFSD